MASTGSDADLEAVVVALRREKDLGGRIGRVLRRTFDQLYDGQHTGRYRWDQLYKTEKTHCGTLVEINLQREFKFGDGTDLDYRIAGVEVDCKYSQSLGGWMVPPEAQGRLCLLVWGDDHESTWSAGLVRALPDYLNKKPNRDRKRTLNTAGRDAIRWLFERATLPGNALLRLRADDVTVIFAHESGQQRLNELFRRALGLVVGRSVVATVARQDDYMKRVRESGGAREFLRSEGIVILGDYAAHRRIAVALQLPVPGPGEFVSVRLAPAAASQPGVAIDGRRWRVAQGADCACIAPQLPKV
jgi:hypothetical protein